MENMEQKIAHRLQILEEKFEYQDQTIETLNDVIIEQQKRMDSMQLTLGKLHSLLAANLVQSDQEDPLPPHY